MRHGIIVAVLAVAACGSEPEQPGADKVAEIERVNEGVAIAARPETILYPDIEAEGLTDPACAFAPDGGGMAPILLAMEGRAVMKFGGALAEFATDAGVQRSPSVAWSKYDGREYSVQFGLGQELTGAGAGERAGKRYEASLRLLDGKDREVYRASGIAQCPD